MTSISASRRGCEGASACSQSVMPGLLMPELRAMTPEAQQPNPLPGCQQLYGWAMLPVSNFRWVEDCDRLAASHRDHPADNPEGLILDVDLGYPEELHEAHNAYPLALERMVVQKDWMSEYQHNLLDVGMAPTEVTSFFNKERYVLHYRNLQLYLSLGMRLTKIHRALGFCQRPWSPTSG